MPKKTRQTRQITPPTRDAGKPPKEPPMAQIASFVDLFVWLLVLKSFFLPLFIIPTGSMAETLAGAHADHTCPNCGYEYAIGPEPSHTRVEFPPEIQCPNCHWIEATTRDSRAGVDLQRKSGDRIIVHGWPYELGGWFGPQRWDVVVFKNPNEPDINYIKRLIGLPGETIEIIDGDIFVKTADDPEPVIARKTGPARRALWFPFYDHDYPPRQPSERANRHSRAESPAYYPRWVTTTPDSPWQQLDTRTPLFDGAEGERGEIAFSTHSEGPIRPPEISDVYGYNSPNSRDSSIVTDIRLSTDVCIEAGDGFVELHISRYDDVFFARLSAAGELTLEIAAENEQRRPLAEPLDLGPLSSDRALRLALAHADGEVTVEVDGEFVLRSDLQRYSLTYAEARRHETVQRFPRARIAAERVRAGFAHLLIERDVHYGAARIPVTQRPGNGVSGNPIALGAEEYFVLGDNSPASLDSRLWTRDMLGPHLWEEYRTGQYNLGTVPADQMIGRAFLVYWPGFLPLSSNGPNIVPDFGRVRWIH